MTAPHAAPVKPSYSLAWNPRPAMLKRFGLLCVALCILSCVISRISLQIPTGFPGVSSLYVASIFYAVTTYWWGGWGLIASFAGALFAAITIEGGTLSPGLAILFALADVWEPLIPFLLLRTVGVRMGIDPLGRNILRRPTYALAFLVFGAVLPTLVSGLWGVGVLSLRAGGAGNPFLLAVASWTLGAAVLLAVFVPVICRVFSEVLERRFMVCYGVWS